MIRRRLSLRLWPSQRCAAIPPPVPPVPSSAMASSAMASSAMAPSDSSVDRMRNIGIVAHIDAGKTTTTERMLYYSGAVQRIGDVDSGTATTDFMKEETDRGITIQSAAVSFHWRGHHVHLIDTPGHADFTVEVERAMRVVDGVVALFDAAVGVEAQSHAVLQQSRRLGAPAIAFVNKMDKFNADFPRAVQSIRAKLALEPLVLQLPLAGDGGGFEGVVDLVDMTARRFRGPHGSAVEERPLRDEPMAVAAAARAARHALFTKLTAVDDTLAEAVVAALDTIGDGGDECEAEALIPPEEVRAAIRRQTLRQCAGHHYHHDDHYDHYVGNNNNNENENDPQRGLPSDLNIDSSRDNSNSNNSNSSVYSSVDKDIRSGLMPVLCGAARRDQGVQPLLDAIAHYLPSPRDRVVSWRSALDGRSAELPRASAGPTAPVIALAFKVTHTTGPKGQRQALVFLRVYSGRLMPRATLRNNNNGRHECVERLYVMRADQREEVPYLIAGEIGAAFLQHTRTGDTLFHPAAVRSQEEKTKGKEKGKEKEKEKDDERWTLEGIRAPPPVISFAVEAATKPQIPLLDEALRELTCEDPSLSVRRNDFGQVVLSGMGELHLEIVMSRLANEFQLQCRLLRAVIEYREAITAPVEVARAVGAAPNEVPYVEASLRLEPLIDGDGVCAADGTCAFVMDETFAADYISGAHHHNHHNHHHNNHRRGGVNSGSAQDQRAAREELRIVSDVFRRSVAECAALGPLAGLQLHAARVRLTALRKLSAAPLTERALAPAARSVVLELLRSAPRAALAALEPMMEVEVQLSEPDFVGSVVASLNERKATRVDIGDDGKSVRAVVPMRNIVRYTMELRKAVKGHANLFTRLHHYRVVEDKTVLARIMKNLGVYENP